jgi:hypothetical protein
VRNVGPRPGSTTATTTFDWLGTSNTIPSRSGPRPATLTSSPGPMVSTGQRYRARSRSARLVIGPRSFHLFDELGHLRFVLSVSCAPQALGQDCRPALTERPASRWQQENEFMNGCSTNWAAYLMSLKSGAEGQGFIAYPNGEISRWD